MAFQSLALSKVLTRYFDLSQSRVETLNRLICGVLGSRTVNLAQIACLEPGTAKVASAYRRFQRFFAFVRLDDKVVSKTLVSMSGAKPPYQLCLDRTNWKLGKHHVNYLVLSVTTKTLRFPVFWRLLDAGSSNHKQCSGLLDQWLACFGRDSIAMLLADREFIGNQWFSDLVQRKIPFVIRMKDNFHVELEDGRTATLKRLAAKNKERGRLKSIRARLPKMVPGEDSFPLFFVAKKRRDGELIVVATHLIDARKALKLYKQRWRIECQFADWKRRGLNIEDTHLRDKHKLSLLLAVVAFASLWAQKVANKLKRKQQPKKTGQGYLRQSYFRVGWDQIRYWAHNDFEQLYKSWKDLWEPVSVKNCLRVV